LHRGLCRSAKEKGASADGPAGPVAPVFEGVELNAIVEQELFHVAVLSAGEDFELTDLFEDARRRRPGGGEVDEVVDLGSK
jgi:hypothetical protein